MTVSYVGLLGAMTGAVLLGGAAERYAHHQTLKRLPLRVHVNGTRGKTSVTRAVAALFRGLGRRTVAKCTGTAPIWIDVDGSEHPWPRQGRARVQEQVRFLRHAARRGAEVVVVECMAVDPTLQWVCERQFVQSHIGVITNVRRDHFEEMGQDLDDIARSLANTIPRRGVLVTGDVRYAPRFAQWAAPLGTRVVVAEPEGEFRGGNFRKGDFLEGDSRDDSAAGAGARIAAENIAIAKEVARQAGHSDEDIAAALPSISIAPMKTTILPEPAKGSVLVHAWAMNDTDSFRSYLASEAWSDARWIPLYNHRMDRPLRALDFGRVFAAAPDLPRVLVTGDGGVEGLFRRSGIPGDLMRRIPFPPTAAAVAEAVADVGGPLTVVGCGNARGLDAGEPGAPATGREAAVGRRGTDD